MRQEVRTISQFIKSHSAASDISKLLEWPPDTFAIAASLLHRSGGYAQAVDSKLGPRVKSGILDRRWRLRNLGLKWRKSAVSKKSPPKEVKDLWGRILKHRHRTVRSVTEEPLLASALLDLLSIADEACAEVSHPFDRLSDKISREFTENVYQLHMENSSTICKLIDPQIAQVLPKHHTPQVGMTLRSLSHYLAFIPKCEVNISWNNFVNSPIAAETNRKRLLNILLIPFPYTCSEDPFIPSERSSCGCGDMDSTFGFFKYTGGGSNEWVRNEFRSLLRKLKVDGQIIHGVVFPETSLTGENEFVMAYEILSDIFPMAFLLAGITASENGNTQRNYIQYGLPIHHPQASEAVSCVFEQDKHHRWRLDKPQIERYRLNQLDLAKTWWEDIEIGQRSLTFFSVSSWLTCCFLICEDLARQEPIAPIVRAIGPNLVIALLQDGPQAANRWASRYAGALTDDPGSSVLTLTSLAMAQRSSRPDEDIDEYCVALWRDRNGTREIKMSKAGKAILLKLRAEQIREHSADGRVDETGSTLFHQDNVEIK